MSKYVPLSLCLMFLCSQVSSGQDLIFRGGFPGGSRSISVTNRDGVKTTNVNENGKKYLIREGQDFVEVEYGKTYGPNDMEALKEKHPELFMHVTAFPKKTGDAKVALHIEIQESAKSDSVEKLQEEHPDAYAIYKKFTKGGGAAFGAIRGGIGIPKVRIMEADAILRDADARAAKQLEEIKKRIEKMREDRGFGLGRPLDKAEKKAEQKSSQKSEQKQEQKQSQKKKVIIDA